MIDPQDYLNKSSPTWCKGCTFHSVLDSLTQALSNCTIDIPSVNIISGIGCSSRLPLFMNTFGMHTLHGRAIPVACGARLARPDIPVIVATGDGDLFSIGMGHFVHAAQKNFNITVLCMDNRMFAMTKNQSSSTSECGHIGTLTPAGKTESALNVTDFAIASGATFVARSIAEDTAFTTRILTKALQHTGFSFVHLLTPCNTFDKSSFTAELQSRAVNINTLEDHNPEDRNSATRYASVPVNNEHKHIYTGIFWKCLKPVFETSRNTD